MRRDAYAERMTALVLTLVGEDRAGLVAAVADAVEAHGGNWETSRLAQLAGAFAGIVEVSVPAAQADVLEAALAGIPGLITVAVRADAAADSAGTRRVSLTVLGNDRPGIVREVAGVLGSRGVSIESMATETRDAAMAGGRLFEAEIAAAVPASVDLAALAEALELLAAEIQVDVTVTDV